MNSTLVACRLEQCIVFCKNMNTVALPKRFKEDVGHSVIDGPSRRGIELEQWGIGSGEVRLYRVGRKLRPKFIDDSRWKEELNRMRAGEV